MASRHEIWRGRIWPGLKWEELDIDYANRQNIGCVRNQWSQHTKPAVCCGNNTFLSQVINKYYVSFFLIYSLSLGIEKGQVGERRRKTRSGRLGKHRSSVLEGLDVEGAVHPVCLCSSLFRVEPGQPSLSFFFLLSFSLSCTHEQARSHTHIHTHK